jgi:hypothetical protein
MANKIQVKRSAVAAKVPTTGDLDLGEIAINTFDGKMFIKKDNGTASIVEIGSGGGGSGDVVGPSSATDNAISRYDGTTGKLIQNSIVTVSDTGQIAGVTSLDAPDYIDFNITATSTNAIGRLFWDNTQKTLSVGLTADIAADIGQTLYAYATNAEATTITKGQPVYMFGASGDRVSVKLASNVGDATSAKTLGVCAENIAAGQAGLILCQGVQDGLNLSAYSPGDTLYLGATAGSLTNVKPAAPNHLVYIGVVERANAGNGRLYVRIQNGFELDEIHDVSIISPVDGNTLIYDATTDLWKNASLTAGSGISITNGAGSITIASTGGLPSQTGNAGKYLKTDGTTASWQDISGPLPTPTLTAPTSGNEGVTITVSINNYNAAYAYIIAVTGGSYSQSGSTILWTLPLVTSNTVHYINVQAVSAGSSSLFGTASVTVNDIPLVSDTSISITDFAFNTLNDGWSL